MMKLDTWGTAGRELRALLDGGATASLSDGELLARFAGSRGEAGAEAEAAFAVLVGRHGSMVWGTCRRILRDPHDAEDAFQATFLLLVRKAGSIRVDDSLGRWLHGVGVRVALRARARAVADRRRGGDLAGLDPPAPPALDPALADLRAAVDEEVARLPASYRSVVVLCHLEGLTRERAAARLGCPVGTVNSRLSRAGELLRVRLARRGLAPASAWLASLGASASAAVPPRLLAATAGAAARVAGGKSLAGTVPAGVAVLLRGILRRMGMMTLLKTTALGSSLIALAAYAAGAGAAGGRPGGDEPRPANVPRPAATVADQPTPGPRPPTRAERARAIEAEWKAANQRCWAEVAKGKNKAEQDAIYAKAYPNELDYFRRCLELADGDPKDPGSRDAWLWIIREGCRNSDSLGPRSGLIAAAVEGLLRHHADDPAVARAALGVHNVDSPNRDALTRGLAERATGREAKGVASLARAQYLVMKAARVEWARGNPTQPNVRLGMHDDQGKPIVVEQNYKWYEDAYYEHLRSCDEAAVREEAEALFGRVIAEFGDVPHNPWKYEGTKVVKNPLPRTLAEVAEASLDDLHNLVVGKPAPEVEGKDLDGRPLKLADHRGKVVVMSFWNSGCGPCLREVPQERELAARLKGRPFALLGVNTDEKIEAARKAVIDANITWPSWEDGLDGPIFRRYHVKGFPTTFVIDAKGVIRGTRAGGPDLDAFVEGLVKEAEAGEAARPAASD